MRCATGDVDIAEITIPAGTLVIANTGAANRDPAVFDHPDRLDITRQHRSPILTFGGGTLLPRCASGPPGTHQAIRALTTRCPNLHRTGPSPWKKLTGVTGPTTLPSPPSPIPQQASESHVIASGFVSHTVPFPNPVGGQAITRSRQGRSSLEELLESTACGRDQSDVAGVGPGVD